MEELLENHVALVIGLVGVWSFLWFFSDREPLVPYPIRDNYYYPMKEGESSDNLLLSFKPVTVSKSNLLFPMSPLVEDKLIDLIDDEAILSAPGTARPSLLDEPNEERLSDMLFSPIQPKSEPANEPPQKDAFFQQKDSTIQIMELIPQPTIQQPSLPQSSSQPYEKSLYILGKELKCPTLSRLMENDLVINGTWNRDGNLHDVQKNHTKFTDTSNDANDVFSLLSQ